jgi:hypothetical protein
LNATSAPFNNAEQLQPLLDGRDPRLCVTIGRALRL